MALNLRDSMENKTRQPVFTPYYRITLCISYLRTHVHYNYYSILYVLFYMLEYILQYNTHDLKGERDHAIEVRLPRTSGFTSPTIYLCFTFLASSKVSSAN